MTRSTPKSVEMREQINFARLAMGRFVHKFKQIRAVMSEFNVNYDKAHDLIDRAMKELIAEQSDDKMEEQRVASVAFYTALLESDTASEAVKAKCRENIDKVLGINKPARVRVETVQDATIDALLNEQLADKGAE